VGRELEDSQFERCRENFAACGLDFSGVCQGDALEPGAFSEIPDGGADAVLCDLPSGSLWRASSDETAYSAFVAEAARMLRPGGRCVLLSSNRLGLARAVPAGLWEAVASWPVGRGKGNLTTRQLQHHHQAFSYQSSACGLVVLERTWSGLGVGDGGRAPPLAELAAEAEEGARGRFLGLLGCKAGAELLPTQATSATASMNCHRGARVWER
ncbi:unnamed protein product, partial [Prorocentrum cordatum]